MAKLRIVTSTSDIEQGSTQSESQSQHQYEIRNIPRSEYHDRLVKANLRHRPWLEILDQFMDPITEGYAVHHKRRMLHFDIKVIHMSSSGNIESIIKCLTPTMFKDATSKEGSEGGGTLVIAKDLSRAMIDSLGMKYELEPEFFASHLEGTELWLMGSWESPAVRESPRAPILLPDYLRKSPFYGAQYRRPYHIKGGKEEIIKLRSSETCTPRGVHILSNELPDMFVSEKISVYKRPGSKIEIILTDQLLSKVPPASYIRTPVTILDDDPIALGLRGRSRQVSSRRELIGWLQRLTRDERKYIFDNQEPLALRPTLKIVERTSHMFLLHARYIMQRMLGLFCDDKFPNSLPFFLSVSRALHRHILDQQKLLPYALNIASLRGGKNLAEQIDDFAYLSEDMERALKALEEDVHFLAYMSSIREGRIVGWVSKFAALFLPLSLLATVLAISDPGYTRWVILGTLSVPFVSISTYFMFFWKIPHVDSFKY
ncbi:hypothetical protein BJ875DRAFT_461054 [Amylocarpus encephaloides]|uniref:Uncharacterized protein n=1 Tax=Amylocarpus encephaloides TaxID=45428 RepID=A0A9P7YKC6_9HELO|nr:hypothetical protein BJ875DRAFT_461054 [Amylocarpus encephaloides]